MQLPRGRDSAAGGSDGDAEFVGRRAKGCGERDRRRKTTGCSWGEKCQRGRGTQPAQRTTRGEPRTRSKKAAEWCTGGQQGTVALPGDPPVYEYSGAGMAPLAARDWLPTTIAGRQGHSGGMPKCNAMELLSRHAGQPGAAGDLRGGQPSGPGKCTPQADPDLRACASRKLEINDAVQLLGSKRTIRLLTVATRCRSK